LGGPLEGQKVIQFMRQLTEAGWVMLLVTEEGAVGTQDTGFLLVGGKKKAQSV